MKLKQPIIDKIKDDKVLLANIAETRNVSYQTVERWCETNHENLLHLGTMQLISKTVDKPIDSLYNL